MTTPINVYTAIIGGKDAPQTELCRDGHIDYHLWSDGAGRAPWQTHPVAENEALSRPGIGPTRRAMWHRWHPHELRELEAGRHLLWIDGNQRLIADPTPLFDEVVERVGADGVGLFPHPSRKCLYDEGAEHLKIGKYDSDAIRAQLAAYRRVNYPRNVGLNCTGFILFPNWRGPRDTRVPLCNRMWEEILRYSYRDQIAFPFISLRVRHKIRVLPAEARDRYFIGGSHLTDDQLEVMPA